MTTVLVIDDDQDIARLIAIKLCRAGFEVTSCADGISGLAAIRAERPHVTIVDWMMPGMDGIAVAREVREEPELRDIKLLMLTARISPADHDLARATGFDDIMTKPFRPTELLTRVQALCDAVSPDGG